MGINARRSRSVWILLLIGVGADVGTTLAAHWALLLLNNIKPCPVGGHKQARRRLCWCTSISAAAALAGCASRRVHFIRK